MASQKNNFKSRSTLEKALEDSSLKRHYLKEAEKLFMGPKGKPEHEKDLRKLENSFGKKSFSRNAAEYVKKYGLPDKWSTLIMLLELKDRPGLVCDVIDRLVELVSEQPPSSSELRGLESRLKIMKMTESDPDVQEAAGEALSRL